MSSIRSLQVVTPPAVEPVTLAEAKAHMEITDTLHDAYIPGLIAAARIQAEVFTRRAIITQTLRQYQDHFPFAGFSQSSPRSLYSRRSHYIRLFRAPLQSVTSIKYIDQNGVQQTWDSTNYIVDAISAPARIGLAFGGTWPPIRVQPNSVIVEYRAGYGDDETFVPANIKQAIFMAVAHWFENRELAADKPMTAVPMGFEALLWSDRVLEF